MPSPVFSVITPVYNDENNLLRCIESVLSQTCKDFEYILINDGSTDSSGSVCIEYAAKDSRIRVFHKENEGISKTRRFGIDNAAGEYIYFVDSDDWINDNFLGKINNLFASGKPDFIFMDFFQELNTGKEHYIIQKPDTDDIIRPVLEGKIYSCLWNVIFRKDFCDKYNINFPDGINYGEDTLFIIELLLNKPEILYFNNAFYHHTFNKRSYTNINKKQKLLERVKFHKPLELLLTEYNRSDLLKHNFFPFIDKYEILYSGFFEKKEYHSIFKLSFTWYFFRKFPFKNFLMLCLSETFLFPLVKTSILINENIKKIF
ncbi:MAG: glycosyltransferase [Treponema sp.]|nr:glycosyltransferase [Treponema sp.]